jgi:hypothetical protein
MGKSRAFRHGRNGREGQMHLISRSVVWLVLLTASAYALMPPEVYRNARAEAPYHVQVAITKVDAPRKGPGDCGVEGQVLRIFKNATGRLANDMIVGFTVACHREGEVVPIGGTIWLDTDALEKADYMEVYLADTAEGFSVPLWNYKLIPKLSDTPQFPVE